MQGLELVPAVAGDWPVAWAIQREAFLALVTATAGGWTSALERQCRESWAPERTRMVWEDGVLLGWLRTEARPDCEWLDLLVIAPSAQGRGLGSRLIRGLQAVAAARAVPLRLSVYRVNPARALYARLGFRETPRDEVRVWMSWTPSS